MSAEQEFITIAKVVKTQGRFGEVFVELFTDFPEKFAERKRLLAWSGNTSGNERDARRVLELEEFWRVYDVEFSVYLPPHLVSS